MMLARYGLFVRSIRAITIEDPGEGTDASGGASIAMPPSAVVRILRLVNNWTAAPVGAAAAGT
jgi:hypothetical protein